MIAGNPSKAKNGQGRVCLRGSRGNLVLPTTLFWISNSKSYVTINICCCCFKKGKNKTETKPLMINDSGYESNKKKSNLETMLERER